MSAPNRSLPADADASPHVSSLTRSFHAVPPAAVPAIIDCVLASTGLSPSTLFSSLLEAFPGLTQDLLKGGECVNLDLSGSNYVVSYVSALCCLIKNIGIWTDALQSFIWRVYMPLLETTEPNNSGLHVQITELLCDLIDVHSAWEIIEATLVPLSLKSVGHSMGMLQNEVSSCNQWVMANDVELVDLGFICSMSEDLPLSIACHVLKSLLSTALRTSGAVQSQENLNLVDNGSTYVESFVKKMLWDLSNMVFIMLLQSPEHRSYAIRLLLPVVLRATDAISPFEHSSCGLEYSLSRGCFLRRVWTCCKSLFSLGSAERRDAYSMLSICFSFFYSNPKEHDFTSVEEYNITEEKEFREEICRGMVDKEALVRKQSLYVLKLSLDHYYHIQGSNEYQCSPIFSESNLILENDVKSFGGTDGSTILMSKREKWAEKEARSLGVRETCILTQSNPKGWERWKTFVLLFEMLEEYGTHLVDAAWTNQISLLLDFHEPRARGACQFQLEDSEGTFSWLTVLWERGFFHENPQVRCLVMQSFLGIDWKNNEIYATQVPKSFVLGPLVQSLNDVVHHKDFGIKEVYTSKTIEGAAKFFYQYTLHFSRREQVAFICSLGSVAKQESFGRAGLMTLACCIASAACRTHGPLRNNGCSGHSFMEQEKHAQGNLQHNITAELLDVLRIVMERSKQHFNPNYRLRVCEQVFQAASSVMCVCDAPLDVVLQFLSAMPREFTDLGGSLRSNIQLWLSESSFHVSSSICSKMEVLKNLYSFPASFIKHSSPDEFVSFTDDDLDAWAYEAQKWARVLYLVITEEQQLEPVFAFLLNCAINIGKQTHNLDWVPSNFLILILGLVQELEVAQEKFNFHAAGDRNGVGVGVSDVFVTFGGLEKFTSILVEVVSFAKTVCSIFWLRPIVSDVLPPSVRGKLGGPSQRRLASFTTTSVLQAILSMKTIACISSWCSKLGKDFFVDSAHTFLWSFCWKVILSSPCDSETGAEIRLAAYEALAPVLKALSTTFSLVDFDLLMAYNRSALANVEGEPLLDYLLLNFLQNINELLTVEHLARSRRAVLMNWKWLCLDSLLSIPYHVIENGVYLRNALPFYSGSTVRNIFVDVVESLENAGEIAVLPILRTVRLILGLLCSARMSSAVSSCSGVNVQMMLQLVHSSWILHSSCNKRRVAPIAALLSSVLHMSVFNDISMHKMTDNGQGPLKWFIEKLLVEGVKSPRTIRLAALHLTGLWLLYPRTLKYYLNELKLLSLYGSVAFDEDFEAELTENHDARMEVSMLAQSPGAEFTEVFINTEMYARVAIAVLFHKLADLVEMKVEDGRKDAQAALHCGKMFLLELLEFVINDKDLAKELYKKHSAIHRHKVRAWQMLCILSRFVDEDVVHDVTSKLHICLYRNNLPAVRHYIETFAIQVYLKFPSLTEEQLIPIFHDYNMRPQALSSYVFIAANVILHAHDLPVQIKHLNELLPPIVPFLTSHHHSLRCFTQLLVYQVLCKLTPVLEFNNLEALPLEKKCFMDLRSYLMGNTECVRLRTSMEGFLDAFDPKTSASPYGIFTAQNEASGFECVTTSLMERVITFLNDVREDLRCSMANDVINIKNECLAVRDTRESLKDDAESLPVEFSNSISVDFQKKATLQKHENLTEYDGASFSVRGFNFPTLSDMEKEDELLSMVLHSRSTAIEKIRENRQQLILVASLLDRIPNLAGLARTCEVFQAAGLAVADASIVHDKQFQLIGVTAEKWVPIIEVPVSTMKIYLEKKRREGYSILGLEQTANSTPLDRFSFPKKTVLVLGREREGIPVDIIHI
ncbi:hypothetical protein QJS10_CPA10g01026 [Acorus calamus]|uniref:tRNA/rRNA methyltransferase SpoU type domain-containing protein n=1 Tax=Acorus calamus TaxID=4465 RepID=A0AAV9DZP4_ACOCL|nr:hypothetical protein QJS10_CPA10g01026 [Acorus calamus]